jgi:hypothetical protein
MKRRFCDVRPEYWGLRCPHCGNEDRFLEIMANESHLVDGRLNYLHLVTAKTQEYRCCECLRVVEPANLMFEE